MGTIRNKFMSTDDLVPVLHCEWMVAALSSQVDAPEIFAPYCDPQTRSWIEVERSIGRKLYIWDQVGGSEMEVGVSSKIIALEGPEVALLHVVIHKAVGDRMGGKVFRFDCLTFPSVIELLQFLHVSSWRLQFGVALSLLQSSRLKPSSVLVFQ